MNTGGYAWLALLIFVAAYEAYAQFTPHGQTLSEWVWMYSPHHAWFKYIVLTSVASLMYHFFWQKH
jgi:hypothetical protein